MSTSKIVTFVCLFGFFCLIIHRIYFHSAKMVPYDCKYQRKSCTEPSYRPQRSCGQGYVFTRVCDSVNGGVGLRRTPPPGPGRPPPQDQADHHHPPPPGPRRTPRTRHTPPPPTKENPPPRKNTAAYGQ